MSCGEVCSYLDARPVLTDVGSDALIGPAEVAAAVTKRTRVVMPVDVAGIGTPIHFIPLHLHPWDRREFGCKPGDFPTAEWIYERAISLPIWPDMAHDQIGRVANTRLTILDSARSPMEV